METAIAESNRRFAEGAAARDACGMASVYAKDADFLPPNAEPMCGREAIECFWRGGIELGIRGLKIETVRLEPGDQLAYEVGSYTFSFSALNGIPAADRATFLVVHVRRADDAWERAAEIFNWDAALA